MEDDDVTNRGLIERNHETGRGFSYAIKPNLIYIDVTFFIKGNHVKLNANLILNFLLCVKIMTARHTSVSFFLKLFEVKTHASIKP